MDRGTRLNTDDLRLSDESETDPAGRFNGRQSRNTGSSMIEAGTVRTDANVLAPGFPAAWAGISCRATRSRVQTAAENGCRRFSNRADRSAIRARGTLVASDSITCPGSHLVSKAESKPYIRWSSSERARFARSCGTDRSRSRRACSGGAPIRRTGSRRAKRRVSEPGQTSPENYVSQDGLPRSSTWPGKARRARWMRERPRGDATEKRATAWKRSSASVGYM